MSIRGKMASKAVFRRFHARHLRLMSTNPQVIDNDVVFPALSTMDLVNMESRQSKGYPRIQSTMQYVAGRDVDPTKRTLRSMQENLDFHVEKEHESKLWENLVSAEYTRPKNIHVTACDMDLVDAAAAKSHFDKVLLVMRHGESSLLGPEVTVGNHPLNGTGVGQSLSLARRTCTFCNDETGLLPELFVVAPDKRSVESALLAFPQFSPQSVKSVPWFCLPTASAANYDIRTMLDLQHEVVGLDCSECEGGIKDPVMASMTLGSEDLLQRADHVLEWIRDRDEKVVVGRFELDSWEKYSSRHVTFFGSSRQL